jgi:hypothetical protein
VKITVIATGFKQWDGGRRHTETRTSFTSSREVDDFPEIDSDVEPPSPMVMEAPPTPAPALAPSEVISLDSMRNAMIANFEQEDLDVPAFLRKRSEAM